MHGGPAGGSDKPAPSVSGQSSAANGPSTFRSTLASDAETLRAALREREIIAEHRINFIRALVITVSGLVDLTYGWGVGTLSPELVTFGVLFFVGFAAYFAVVHVLSRGHVYRAWLKYLTVTVDYALTITVFIEYRHVQFFRERAHEGSAAEFIAFLMLLNFLSAFRHSRAIIVYSTLLATSAALFLSLVFTHSLALQLYAPLVLLASGGLTFLLSSGLTNLFSRLRQRERLMRFLPREVVRGIDAGDIQLQLGGVKREVTVLLSDIRQFTTLSEDRDPDVVVALLNEYFTAMATVIWAHRGTIDKFIGDAILAVFGVPVGHPDDAMRAVEAALAMHQALAELNARWTAHGAPTVQMGIALHTGTVVAGNVGAPDRMEYTIIGDAVNVTARIEELNKVCHTTVLLSESTRDRIADRIPTELVTTTPLRGRHTALRIFTPVSADARRA